MPHRGVPSATPEEGRGVVVASGGPPRARAGAHADEDEIRAMFDRIAPVYDRLNTLMTLGADAGWRRAAVRAARLRPGDRAVDVACGTGKLSVALAERVGPLGWVVGIDIAPSMVALARRAQPAVPQLGFREGNALDLPFEVGTFDAATIAFGLRNLAGFEAGFRELARVVRPGGRVVCLELTLPRPRWWARVFHATFRTLAPALGAVAGQRDAYRYLPASLDGFPDPAQLAGAMRRAGLVDVGWRRLGLGTVALHVGSVPGSGSPQGPAVSRPG